MTHLVGRIILQRLAILRPLFEKIGFVVETGKTKDAKIDVPVLFGVDNKVSAYFKKPYMRKNVKRNKSVIKNIFDEEQQDEDEKIKFDEKDLKMEDIKDDDSKTNNDSIEETCNFFDKKKNQ